MREWKRTWRASPSRSGSGDRLTLSGRESTLPGIRPGFDAPIAGALASISLLCLALHPLRSPPIMDSEQRAELLTMLARESFFERELTLASGRASNYYVDCKRTLYLPRGAYLAGELVLELVMSAGVQHLARMAPDPLPVTP